MTTSDRPGFERYLAVLRKAYLTVELAPPEMNLPASEDAIAALEKAVGHALPAGLHKAWLVADGQGITPDAPVFWQIDADDEDEGRLVGYDFLSVEQAREAHAGLANREQLPFADFGAGAIRLMIDFASSPVGAVIAVASDDMTWIASSFEALLERASVLLASDPDHVLQEITQDGSIPRRRERRDDRE